MGNAASYPWEADAEDQCSLISQHMQLMVLQSGGWHMQAKSHRGQQEKQPSQFGLLGQQVSIQRVIEGTLQSHDWAQLTHMSHTPNAPTNCQPKHVGQHPRARRHWCISRRMRSTTRYKETARNTAAGRGMRRSDRGAVLADTVGKVRAAINSKMCPCSIIPQYNTRAAHFLQIFLSRIAGLWKASFRSHGDGLDAAWMVAPKEKTCPVCPARTLGKREGASLSHVSRKVRLLVSSIQAVLASTAGYIVASSCKDVIHDQHWLAATYTRFAVPYFIYDIYAMYLCYEHKHKLKGHSGGWSLTRAYLYKEFLMILHHVFMVAVCFPVSVLWRDGKGDFFLGCMLMAEVSTPFVCFGKILIQYKKQHTLLHRVNGVLMLVTFFCCRLLLFPYMYWVYGQRVGLPLYRVPFNLSPEYNLGAAILMAPQVYWFYLICRRAYTLFRQSVLSQRPKNGHPAPVSTSAKEQDCSQ